MINPQSSLEEVREYFQRERFATVTAGCTILEAKKDYAVCELKVRDEILNANDVVMGGAIFTLADLAFAVASNMTGVPSVGMDCTIRYLSAADCCRLTATCTAVKSGKRIGYYRVMIRDENGKDIAEYQGTAFRILAE